MSTKVAKPSAGPTRTKGFFRKHVVDPMTLRKFVRAAMADAIQVLAGDPYLRRTLAEAETKEKLKDAYDAIDDYVAGSVEFYLRNRSANERVRARKVSCVSATDLETRQARCIVTVEAWGHMRREIIDLELPEP